MNFNEKYQNYVSELPRYVLIKIKNNIENKYNCDDENPEIDEIFEKHKQLYLKKRTYDKEYYNKKTKTDRQVEAEEKLEVIRKQRMRWAKEMAAMKRALREKESELESALEQIERDQDLLRQGAIEMKSLHQKVIQYESQEEERNQRREVRRNIARPARVRRSWSP